MAFLLGAFGKLNAGKYYRSLQSKMMKIQARARRVTRDVEKMTKMIDRDEKNQLNALKLSMNSSMFMAQQVYQKQYLGTESVSAIMSKMGDGTKLTGEEQAIYNNAYSLMNQQVAQMKAQQEAQVAQEQQRIQDYFEQMREDMLEPLKDEEETLQTEKDSLESQIQLAKADYEACKQMEQQDAKMLAPSYTAQA